MLKRPKQAVETIYKPFFRGLSKTPLEHLLLHRNLVGKTLEIVKKIQSFQLHNVIMSITPKLVLPRDMALT
jgi:hypothetical protein